MKSIVAFLYSLILFEPSGLTVEKWVIEESSNLCIEGKTNISPFKCEIIEYLKEDTITLYRENTQAQQSRAGYSCDFPTDVEDHCLDVTEVL